MNAVHVLPLNNLVEHEDTGTGCVCGPQERPVKQDDGSVGWVAVHNSLDGRELHEEDRTT